MVHPSEVECRVCCAHGGHFGDLYLPYDPEIPLICMDEQPIQLLEDSRPSAPMKRGK